MAVLGHLDRIQLSLTSLVPPVLFLLRQVKMSAVRMLPTNKQEENSILKICVVHVSRQTTTAAQSIPLKYFHQMPFQQTVAWTDVFNLELALVLVLATPMLCFHSLHLLPH